MTNETALKLTAEIVVDTLKHMSAVEGIEYAQVVELVFIRKNAKAVARFNKLMDVAAEYIRNN